MAEREGALLVADVMACPLVCVRLEQCALMCSFALLLPVEVCCIALLLVTDVLSLGTSALPIPWEWIAPTLGVDLAHGGASLRTTRTCASSGRSAPSRSSRSYSCTSGLDESGGNLRGAAVLLLRLDSESQTAFAK